MKDIQFRISETGLEQGNQGDVMITDGELFGTIAGQVGNNEAINTTYDEGEFLAGKYLLLQTENNGEFRACEVEVWGVE